MELLSLRNFKKAYPTLLNQINKVRGKPIDEEYSSSTKVPIKMQDAEMIDAFLETNNRQINNFGYEKAQKIFEVIKANPDLTKWLNIIYPKQKSIKKKTERVSEKGGIIKEIVLHINVKNNIYKGVDDNGKDWSKLIGQRKLEYAYNLKRLIKIKKYENGEYINRVVKEKFIKGN